MQQLNQRYQVTDPDNPSFSDAFSLSTQGYRFYETLMEAIEGCLEAASEDATVKDTKTAKIICYKKELHDAKARKEIIERYTRKDFMVEVHPLNFRIRYIDDAVIKRAGELHKEWLAAYPSGLARRDNDYQAALFEKMPELSDEVAAYMRRYCHLWCLEYAEGYKDNYFVFDPSKKRWFYFGPVKEAKEQWLIQNRSAFDIEGVADAVFNEERLPIAPGDLISAGYSHPLCPPALGVFCVYKPLLQSIFRIGEKENV